MAEWTTNKGVLVKPEEKKQKYYMDGVKFNCYLMNAETKKEEVRTAKAILIKRLRGFSRDRIDRQKIEFLQKGLNWGAEHCIAIKYPIGDSYGN